MASSLPEDLHQVVGGDLRLHQRQLLDDVLLGLDVGFLAGNRDERFGVVLDEQRLNDGPLDFGILSFW